MQYLSEFYLSATGAELTKIRSIKQILEARFCPRGERRMERKTKRKIARIGKRLRGAAGSKYEFALKIYRLLEPMYCIHPER